MRVISGDARGRPLFLPPKSKVRPTSDRIKEALFNILVSVRGKLFLDVCAGAGSVGIEALSRGAASTVFVEKDVANCDYIQKNLLRCGFTDNFDICRAEVLKAFPFLARKGLRFDIIFADPPYEVGLVEKMLLYLAEGTLSAAEGLIIFQHSVREEPDWKQVAGLRVVDQRKYGDTLLTFIHQFTG